MLKINGQSIRPAPLVGISHSPIRNKVATLGSIYTITLNGTIVSPGTVAKCDRLQYILDQQNRIRNLFSKDGHELNIYDGALICYPNLISIDFQEGQFIDTCSYTITLEAPFLKSGNNILPEGLLSNLGNNNVDSHDGFLRNPSSQDYNSIINTWGGLVEDFTDTWAVEYDNGFFDTTDNYSTDLTDDSQDIKVPHIYRLSRNMTVVGRTVYDNASSTKTAFDNAIGFLKKTVLDSANRAGSLEEKDKWKLYPGYLPNNIFSKDTLNIKNAYKCYNHSRTINYDRAAGSCSVNDSWILASGTNAIENYTISIDTSRDNARTNVKINGTIKGLSEYLLASGYQEGHFNNPPYSGAIEKYNNISNTGQFGINCGLYRRAKYVLPTGNIVTLNSQPLSVSLASNELAGEITYSIEFDNRPQNYFTGVLGENITVNDTYPGDSFSLIPIIGRSAGPLISYNRTRTVYSRNVNIEIFLDPTDLSYAHGDKNWTTTDRTSLMLRKPSLNSNIRDNLRDLIRVLAPFGEPNVSGIFLNPPTETWIPKEGRYTLSLNWNYEKTI